MADRFPGLKNPSAAASSQSDAVNSKPQETLVKSNPEIEAIFQEARRLEREGKLDAAAIADIDAQMQAIADKLRKDLADRLAEINAAHPPTSGLLSPKLVLPQPWRLPFLAFLVFVVAGTLLELTIGSGFIFAGVNEYHVARPWVYAVLLPLFAAVWYLVEKSGHILRIGYPTWMVRWIVMYPLLVIVSAAVVVVSPLGWAAVFGWVMGAPSDRVEISVISVASLSSNSRGCDQHAELAFRGASARICLEGRLSGAPPVVGEKIMASGRVSRLGLFIDHLEHQ